MNEHYQRVAACRPSLHQSYSARGDGPLKVVPADAIVIEPGEIPGVRVGIVGELISDCAFTRSATADPALIRREALALLAISEHLAAHPPIDEAQVEALAADLSNTDKVDKFGWFSFGVAQDYARRLVEQGWTKPEAS